MQKSITVNNVREITPEEIHKILSEMYDNVLLPEEALSLEDLERMSSLLGWTTNQKAYLNSLYIVLDIATSRAKESGDKAGYSEMMIRKKIVKSYYDHVDDIYKACSRQVTTWIEVRKEKAEISRQENLYREAG